MARGDSLFARLEVDWHMHPKCIRLGSAAAKWYYLVLYMRAVASKSETVCMQDEYRLQTTWSGLDARTIRKSQEKCIEANLLRVLADGSLVVIGVRDRHKKLHGWKHTPGAPCGDDTGNDGAPVKPLEKRRVEAEKSREEEKREIYTAAFEELWKIYPRKLGKKAAAKCVDKLVRDGAQTSSILEAAKNYAKWATATKKEAEFIKHASTFYGPDAHWEDWKDGIPEGEMATEAKPETTVEMMRRTGLLSIPSDLDKEPNHG